MVIRKLIPFLLLLIPNVYGNTSALETLRLSTTIDLAKLYMATVEAKFNPSTLKLEVKADRTGFKPAKTTLEITTKIPQSASAIKYKTTLTVNETNCFSYDSPTVPVSHNNFTQVKIAGTVVSTTDSTVPNFVSFSDFDEVDANFKVDNHLVELSFIPFSNIKSLMPMVKSCTGKIEVTIGVAL